MDRADRLRSDARTHGRRIPGRGRLTDGLAGPRPDARRHTGGVDVLIIGAGPAGLAAAYELLRVNVAVEIIDGADRVASSWRGRHDQLCLNTHRSVSHQPGMKIPGGLGPFPSRDDYIAYLERYESFLGKPVRYGTQAERIDRDGEDSWKVATNRGALRAPHVVVATGSDRLPHMPDWPGRDTFPGELIHASQFRHARVYTGRRVLLVGAGNSGVDIGNHLASVDIGPSWVSIRNGPNIAPQYFLGLPAQLIVASLRWLPVRLQDLAIALVGRLVLGDLSKLGIPPAPKGAVTRQLQDCITLAVDNGFIAALRAKRFRVVPTIRSFCGQCVRLEDDSQVEPDAVICATGYRLGLESLVGHLDVLDEHGRPRYVADQQIPASRGLWFLGHNSSLYGNMNIRRRESRRLARRVAKDIARRPEVRWG